MGLSHRFGLRGAQVDAGLTAERETVKPPIRVTQSPFDYGLESKIC
jgi:hypothetical protein